MFFSHTHTTLSQGHPNCRSIRQQHAGFRGADTQTYRNNYREYYETFQGPTTIAFYVGVLFTLQNKNVIDLCKHTLHCTYFTFT